MSRALASVKVEREKLLELLREAKDEKLAQFDEGVRKFNENVAKLRERAVKAASADLSKEGNLDALELAVREYTNAKNRHRYQYDKTLGTYLGTEHRQQIEHRYDSAIKLVTISADDTFKVTSNTEFGYLLGF